MMESLQRRKSSAVRLLPRRRDYGSAGVLRSNERHSCRRPQKLLKKRKRPKPITKNRLNAEDAVDSSKARFKTSLSSVSSSKHTVQKPWNCVQMSRLSKTLGTGALRSTQATSIDQFHGTYVTKRRWRCLGRRKTLCLPQFLLGFPWCSDSHEEVTIHWYRPRTTAQPEPGEALETFRQEGGGSTREARTAAPGRTGDRESTAAAAYTKGLLDQTRSREVSEEETREDELQAKGSGDSASARTRWMEARPWSGQPRMINYIEGGTQSSRFCGQHTRLSRLLRSTRPRSFLPTAAVHAEGLWGQHAAGAVSLGVRTTTSAAAAPVAMLTCQQLNEGKRCRSLHAPNLTWRSPGNPESRMHICLPHTNVRGCFRSANTAG
ncbi:hypothetical protein HPB51_024267 [Rhipicephalus microplus]|uniref:Uncharacterized protein n=1 Tax=Rhipicephalus microplus TaxID=6941 RepID=A0A9J6EK09_RHIMP|nr:hypothetical protein HPB51_024267 [Rhipicephalus microplus]